MKYSLVLLLCLGMALTTGADQKPPQESILACENTPQGAQCSFESPKGQESGTCEYTPDGTYFSCRPARGNAGPGPADTQEKSTQPTYSITQATADETQLHTIAFAALSFMSSDLCDMSFLPPGKHASYFGFQYLRDVVGGAEGHGQNFVPKVAHNLLYILNEQQEQILIDLAEQQKEKIIRFAATRFPLLIAFERYADKRLPAGTSQLNRSSIVAHSADLYTLDGELSYERALGFGKVVQSLSDEQKTALEAFTSMPFSAWPEREAQLDKRNFDHDVHIALMTYASELLSWYVGDLNRDIYFTPERTAAYFGAYWTKAAPMKAVARENYTISTALTGDSGKAFLSGLNKEQQTKISDLIHQQKPYLMSMVEVRTSIATELRKIFAGQTADADKVIGLSRTFGELDGEIAYLYATAYTDVRQSLTTGQMEQAVQLRNISEYQCDNVFLYAEPADVPEVANIERFFQ